MNISQSGLQLIKEFEGFRAQAYQDSVGVWTIGYGSTRGVKRGDMITEAAASQRMLEELHGFENEVESIAKKKGWNLTQGQFDALVSFNYNVGFGNLKKLTESRQLSQIPDGMLLYCRAGNKILPGLKRRREAEARLFKS
jgi:lysozyme